MNVYGAQTYAGVEAAARHQEQQQEQQRVAAATDEVLGKDDFLKLLVTQLAYQDPLDPVNDREFIAQLAQFSSLEQMQNVAKGIEQLTELQLWLGGMSQAASLIGRNVVLLDYETGDPVEGTVDAVRMEGGVPILVVDGNEYSLWDVVEVKATGPADEDA